MRQKVIEIAKKAGSAIMDVYKEGDFSEVKKEDGSPVTRADLAANRIIEEGLRESFKEIPIVSEETFDGSLDRSALPLYWLVDPLDGTKEFIARRDSFTVNIALMREQKPILGVVYVPATHEIYSAENGKAYKEDEVIHAGSGLKMEKAVTSFNHQSDKLASFLKLNGITETSPFGSSLKFCKMAEGAFDLYPRFGPTSEWDTAAGQAICEASGLVVMQMGTKEALCYGKKDIKNPGFYVVREGVSIRFL